MSYKAEKWAKLQKLSGNVGLVLNALADKLNKNGVCWPQQQTIAEELGITDRTVRNCIRKLEELNLVRGKHRYGKSGRRTTTVYELNLENNWEEKTSPLEEKVSSNNQVNLEPSKLRTNNPLPPEKVSGKKTSNFQAFLLKVYQTAGLNPDGRFDHGWLSGWLTDGKKHFSEEQIQNLILSTVSGVTEKAKQRNNPPQSLKYFNNAVRDAIEKAVKTGEIPAVEVEHDAIAWKRAMEEWREKRMKAYLAGENTKTLGKPPHPRDFPKKKKAEKELAA